MNREQIKDLFPTVKNNPFVEHRITNIEDRIKNIEDEGYTFQGIHTEKIRTELRPAGSFDFFDPNGFERMSGEELTIATFKNEEDKHRYCIVNSSGDILYKPLSTLRGQEAYMNSLYDASQDIEKTNEMRACLEKEGIHLSNNQVYAAFQINSGDDFARMAQDIKEDVTFFLSNMQKIQESKEPPKGTWGELNRFVFANELSLNLKNRQNDAVQSISRHMKKGYNSSEQKFISDTVIEMMNQVGKEMLRDGQFLDAETARLAKVRQEAASEMQQKFTTMNPAEKAQMVRDYLTTFRGKETKQGEFVMVPKTAHPSIIKGVVEAMDAANEKGTFANGGRINNDLRKIGGMIAATGNIFHMNASDMQEATKNIVQNYVSHELGGEGPYSSYRNLTYALENVTDITVYTESNRIEVQFPDADQYLKVSLAFIEEAAGIPESQRMTEKQMDKYIKEHYKESIEKMEPEYRRAVAESIIQNSREEDFSGICSVLKEDPDPEIKKLLGVDTPSLPEGNQFNMYFKDILESAGISTMLHTADEPEFTQPSTDDVSL